MPHIEDEVLEYAMMVVKESSETQAKRFTEAQIRRIALHVVRNDKLHEPEWIGRYVLETSQLLKDKRKSAQAGSVHQEFTSFTLRLYQRFCESYGDDAFANSDGLRV